MCNNILVRTCNVTETPVSALRFLIDITLILKAIKSNIERSYDKQKLTLVAISYKIYETRRRLLSEISDEMTTRISKIFL